jgi:hypothetical protein
VNLLVRRAGSAVNCPNYCAAEEMTGLTSPLLSDDLASTQLFSWWTAHSTGIAISQPRVISKKERKKEM